MSADTQRVGWGWPDGAVKTHFFFNEPISLCRKWMFTGELVAPLDPGGVSDCAACRKKLAALKLRRTSEKIEATA